MKANTIPRRRALVCAAIVGALFAVPIGAGAQLSQPAKPVFGTMNEWKISLSPTRLSSGKTRLTVRNKGKVVHEVIVIRTDLAGKKLPMLKGQDRFDEKAPALTLVGEIGDLKVGRSDTKEFDLKPGHYVFACNLAGHYRNGMYTELTVK